MKIFLDTSSLFKLYHKESGTEDLIRFFENNKIDNVYLSEITKIEFDSTVWKKFRMKEIGLDKVKIMIEKFKNDCTKYSFISDNNALRAKAKNLISIYGYDGLRTLDSLQLASALDTRKFCDSYFTSDHLLNKLFKIEKLNVH